MYISYLESLYVYIRNLYPYKVRNSEMKESMRFYYAKGEKRDKNIQEK